MMNGEMNITLSINGEQQNNMSTGNTLMVRDMLGRTYLSNNGGGLEPKPWWIIAFIIVFIIFESIKWTFFR